MKDPSFVGPMIPIRGNNIKGSFSPQLKPKPTDLSLRQNTRTDTQTAVNAASNRRGKRTKGKSKPLDYIAPFLMDSDGDSSSNSDSFTAEDKKGSFPIDSSRTSSVKFSFPVKSVVDTITDDFLYSSNGQKSVKQHISLSMFLPDTATWSSLNANSLVKDQFSNCFDRWTTQIQEVRMNTSMYSFWSIALVYRYIHTVVQGLSIYCCLDSILAIDEPAGEVNRVNALMRTFYNDPDLLVIKDALRQKLKNQWLPVEMRSLILWTYQLYKTHDSATSIQYRFVPHSAFVKADTADDPVYRLGVAMNTVISILEESDMTRVRSILRSSLPSGCINRIPNACSKPTCDDVHHELFANQPCLWNNSSNVTQVFPELSSSGGGYNAYGMKANPTSDNGFAFALSQSYKSGSYKDNDTFNTFVHSRYTSGYLTGTNNFHADATSFNAGNVLWNRNTKSGVSAFDEVGLINLVEISTSTSYADRANVVMPLGYQRVYFNSFGQRTLVAKEVFRKLFSAS